ncbi:MAG TPA: DEAD/DEAH box helicase [Polyangiaceae bacterium]|jgi:ATP-dependent RNA helicase DeaD
MIDERFASLLGPALTAALEKKGFTKLTPVQESVLDQDLSDRDLRISSQTGSGKTIAVGFALRQMVTAASTSVGGVARPAALVVAPTRELARQVEQELAWLFAALSVKVASATGGASYRDERRALGFGPAVVVGTPGRLLDHLRRGSIDPSHLGAIVLDEADRMLDLGFREDLEAILACAPAGHRTHLISATFPSYVRSLADRVQVQPVLIEGTPLGKANTDIDHVVHLVDPNERVDAIVNLLLASPDEQTLVFARTRADVAAIARELYDAGFLAGSISGEMEQMDRNRALDAFKRGKMRVLVATDVAARGIDVQDITRVIHADPPDDADSYTHRSGRTGRAGRKGRSAVLTSPSALSRTSMLLKRARVSFKVEPIPTAEDIESSRDARNLADLVADDPQGFAGYDKRIWALAQRLGEAGNVPRTIARLLARGGYADPVAPRTVRAFAAAPERIVRSPLAPRESRGVGHRPMREARPTAAPQPQSYVAFRVSWGAEHGADARRLLAMVCRRGSVQGADVGAIRIARGFSTVEIATGAAMEFARASRRPDPRNPRVFIEQAKQD